MSDKAYLVKIWNTNDARILSAYVNRMDDISSIPYFFRVNEDIDKTRFMRGDIVAALSADRSDLAGSFVHEAEACLIDEVPYYLLLEEVLPDWEEKASIDVQINLDDLCYPARLNLNGSSLMGFIDCSYETLVGCFGNPVPDGFDSYKCDAEWQLDFGDDIIATIYNWKSGQNYNGLGAPSVEEITHWHVGGFNKMALNAVEHLLSQGEAS